MGGLKNAVKLKITDCWQGDRSISQYQCSSIVSIMILFASAAVSVEVTIPLTRLANSVPPKRKDRIFRYRLSIMLCCSSIVTIFGSLPSTPSSNGDFVDSVKLKVGAIVCENFHYRHFQKYSNVMLNRNQLHGVVYRKLEHLIV